MLAAVCALSAGIMNKGQLTALIVGGVQVVGSPLPGSDHPRIWRNVGRALRLSAVNELSASEAHRAAVSQFSLFDAFAVDEGAVAALQVVKRVCVLRGHQFGVTFGDRRVLDDEGVVESAAD